MVTVVLALAFFFEYAFENRWITESGRVLLGLACGAAAFGAGEYFFRRGQRAYGQALAAAGVAFFYLSLWAAFGLYHLVPQVAALSLMVVTTAAAGFLALPLRQSGRRAARAGGRFRDPASAARRRSALVRPELCAGARRRRGAGDSRAPVALAGSARLRREWWSSMSVRSPPGRSTRFS